MPWIPVKKKNTHPASFDNKNRTRTTTPIIGNNGTYRAMLDARNLYINEVLNSGKRYERYVEDYLLSRQYHDAEDAFSKNEHMKNLNLIAGILRKRKEVAVHWFTRNDFTMEDFVAMKNTYDTGAPLPKTQDNDRTENVGILSFFPDLGKEEYDAVASCANELDIFTVRVSGADIEALLTCNLATPLDAKSNRLLALLFDILRDQGRISKNWQHILERSALVRSSRNSRPLTAKTLSSALYQVREGQMTSAMRMMESRLAVLDRI